MPSAEFVVLVKPDVDEAAAGRSACPSQPAAGTGELQVADPQSFAALNEEIAALREAVSARDAFLAVAAHELRNPMTPIVGRVQQLRRLLRKPDFRPETLDKRLEQIEWLIAQYVKRASILLDVSRVTSGKFQLDPAPTNVSNLIREVVGNFELVAEFAGSSLTCRFTEGDIHRLCDRLALEQILDNLVSNAIKYGAGKPIVVSASEDAASGSVTVHVADQGPGISIENQARIFERFERVVRPGQNASGFGVGLWVVGQLVETMGGSIRIASQPDKGSTFTVSLPLPTLKVPE